MFGGHRVRRSLSLPHNRTMGPLPHSRRQCERLGQMVLRLRCGRRLRLPDKPPLNHRSCSKIPFPDSHVRTESDPDLPGRNFHILTEKHGDYRYSDLRFKCFGIANCTHPPSKRTYRCGEDYNHLTKRNAAQSKIKFRRPKQIRYKRIQPPKTILHTSLNTRKSSPFFASDRNRSGSILRSVPQFLPSENVLHQQGGNDRTEKAPNRQHKRSPEQIAPGFFNLGVLSLEAINARNTEVAQRPFVELGMRSPVPISDSRTESRRPVERKTYRSPLEET